MLSICRAAIENSEAYQAGWNAAEQWNNGDDDAPTRAPKHYTTGERKAWSNGFAHCEEYEPPAPTYRESRDWVAG